MPPMNPALLKRLKIIADSQNSRKNHGLPPLGMPRRALLELIRQAKNGGKLTTEERKLIIRLKEAAELNHKKNK